MEQKAILGVPWTVVSFATNKLVTTATTLVLVHLLAPSDFGLIALAMIVINLLFWFGGLGFANALIVRQDLDVRGQGTAFTLMLGSGIVAAAVAAAASSPIAQVFGNARVSGILHALACLFVTTPFTSFYDALLQRELEFRRRFAALGTQTLANAAIAITLALNGAGVWSLVGAAIGSSLLYGAVLLTIAPHRVRPAFDRTVARTLLVTGRGFLAQGVTVFVRQNADNITVGRAFGAPALGFYSMAYRLGDLSYWAIADPVARVTFPAFARARARGEDIRSSFLGVLRLVALVGCPAGVLLSAAAEPFTRAILGTRWLPMAAPLMVLGIWSALRPIDTTLFWLLNSVERADLVAWLSLAILAPLIPGFIVAISVGHLTAVALVVLIDTAVSLLLLALLVRRHVKIELRAMWGAVAPIVIASPVAWLVTFAASSAVGARPAGVALVCGLASGIATYALLLSLLDRALLRQAAKALLRTLGRAPRPASVPS